MEVTEVVGESRGGGEWWNDGIVLDWKMSKLNGNQKSYVCDVM